MFYGEYEEATDEDNVTEVKNTLGLKKRGCLACKHYENCTMTCWISIIFNGYQTKECPLSRIYDYITEEQIADYVEWKKEFNL
jgi:hypothetical protein